MLQLELVWSDELHELSVPPHAILVIGNWEKERKKLWVLDYMIK